MHPLYLGVILAGAMDGGRMRLGGRSIIDRISLARRRNHRFYGSFRHRFTWTHFGNGRRHLRFLFLSLAQTASLVGITVAVIAFFAIGFQDSLLSNLDSWSGGNQTIRAPENLTFDNQSVRLSSARSRIVLFEIYWKALMQGGLLGYGSEAVSTSRSMCRSVATKPKPSVALDGR